MSRDIFVHDDHNGEPIQAHPLLQKASLYILSLETELERLKKKAQEESAQAKEEIRYLLERSEKSEQECRQYVKVQSRLETQLEEREGILDDANRRAAELLKQLQAVSKERDEYKATVASLEEQSDQLIKKREEDKKEIERIQADRSRLERRIEDREYLLEEERRKTFGSEKQLRRLSLLLSEAEGKNALHEQRMEETLAKHAEEIKRLNQRLMLESKTELQALQNRIEAGLKSHYQDYLKIINSPLIEDMGDSLNAVLKAMFHRLRDLGLEFDDNKPL